MSTFDAMCDWQDKTINSAQAVKDCLRNLELSCPEVKDHEAFIALCTLLSAELNFDYPAPIYWDWIK